MAIPIPNSHAPPTRPLCLPLTQAKQAALAFNSMIDRVAGDEAYLQQVLAAAAQEDEFTVGAACPPARLPACPPATGRAAAGGPEALPAQACTACSTGADPPP